MKKIIKIGIAILSISALTPFAYAAKQGAYLGGGLGVSRLDSGSDFLIKGEPANFYNQIRRQGGFGGRVFGGYNINPYFGVEAGFTHYADSTYKSTPAVALLPESSKRFSLNAGDLVGKIYLPLGESGFNLYGLGGAAYVQSKIKNKNNPAELLELNKPVTETFTDKVTDKLRAKYGVGVSYDIPQSNITTNVEWSRIQGKGDVKKDLKAIPNSDVWTLNIAYNFG